MSELIEERVVVERFGVSLQDCVRFRKDLRKGEDWIVQKERGVLWVDVGIKKLAFLLGVPVPILEKEKEGPVVVTAVKVDFLNRRIILAEAKDGRKVRVRVKDAGLYVPRMAFEARQVVGDLFEALRAPRARGVA
jgi:hypothetical protein